MNDDNGPQGDATRRRNHNRSTSLWATPPSRWPAAFLFLLEAAARIAIDTASVLLESLLIVVQTMTWRRGRRALP